MRPSRLFRGAWVGVLALAVLLAAPAAHAVPSFARQTGMACEACHTVFPELTHFGRMFKANGYTVDNLKPVRGINAAKQELLSLSGLPPISLMLQVSQSNVSKALPDSTGSGGHSQTSSTDFPQQISLFYAGKIAPQVGAFIQLTYGDDAGSIGIDNVDVRYADSSVLQGDRSLIWGIAANNNPTVQDLWNSTPAFGYPYAASDAVVSPIAASQIDGTLGQDVAGISAYLMWNESLYAELGTYRSAKQGAANPITGAVGPLDGATSNVITGGAPYYRLAYEHQWGRHDLEVGLYGATFKLAPGGDGSAPASLSGPVNEFRDFAEDFQYQWISDAHLVTVAGTHIQEKMTLNASYDPVAGAQNLRNDLSTTRLWATYYYHRRYGATLGMFSTTGSTDAGLYPAADPADVLTYAVSSANGKPDTKGWIAELNFMPWLNTRLSLQATQYSKFNGGSNNYDGVGRNASDNNSLYLLAWFNY